MNIALGLKGKAPAPVENPGQLFANMSMAMIFEKPSTRTRLSFEIGMTQLGGHALYLSPKDMQIGRGETVADTSRVISRYADFIIYRAFKKENVHELARHASIPVLNALDDWEHPCQAAADILTILEHKCDNDISKLKDVKFCYVGDGNNVCHSLMVIAAYAGMDFVAITPPSRLPDEFFIKRANELNEKYGGSLKVTSDPDAVEGQDVLYTDVWVSMGEESEEGTKENEFTPYQFNREFVSKAKPDAIIMHCLPAHRGTEITDEVVDSEQSVVFDQAENRLHAQKALLVWLYKNGYHK